jgi:hypothetical protein
MAADVIPRRSVSDPSMVRITGRTQHTRGGEQSRATVRVRAPSRGAAARRRGDVSVRGANSNSFALFPPKDTSSIDRARDALAHRRGARTGSPCRSVAAATAAVQTRRAHCFRLRSVDAAARAPI